MTFVTDFADQAVVLPVILATAAVLAFQGWRRGAVAWLAAVAGTFAVMLVLKLAFLACASVLGPLDLHSPSGHVAATTVVVAGLTALIVARSSVILPIAALAAGVIGGTRLVLGVHSVTEVLAGGLVGLIGAAALVRLAGPPPALRLAPILATTAVLVLLLHGTRLPAEAAIRATAGQFAGFVPACRAVAAD